MNSKIRKSLLTVAVSGLLAAPVAQATNGYFMHGYGTKEKGVAGAGVAYNHDDSLAAGTNPAAMAFVSKRVDLGLQIFAPSPRGYTVTGAPPAPVGTPVFDPATGQCNFPDPSGSGACAPPFSVDAGTVESDNDVFLLPHFGWNNHLGQDWTVGIAIYGNGGLNSEYKSRQRNLAGWPTPGDREFTRHVRCGNRGRKPGAAVFQYQLLRTRSIRNMLSAPAYLLLPSVSALKGWRISPSSRSNQTIWPVTEIRSHGAWVPSWVIRVKWRMACVWASATSPRSLWRSSRITRVCSPRAGTSTFPSTYTLGVSFDVGSTGVILADYQRIMYTDVKSISNPISKLTDGSCLNGLNNFIQTGTFAAAGDGCLGGSNGAGFGWEDIGIFKVGYMWNAANIDWRLGYSYSDQTIPESEVLFNILAPATIKHHVTAGMTKAVGNNQELNLSLMYAPEEQVKGPNPFDGGATTIEIYMSQWDVQAGWAWKF